MLTLETMELLRSIMTEATAEETPGEDNLPADEDKPLDEDTVIEDKETEDPISIRLKKLRSENAKWRTDLRKSEAKIEKMAKAQAQAEKDAEIAKLDDVKQAQARTDEANKSLAEAEAKAADMAARLDTNAKSQAVYQAANAAGFEYPEDAIKLLDAGEIEVVDGKVDDQVITEMIDTLAENRPNLLKQEESSGEGVGATNPRQRRQPGPRLTDKKIVEQMKSDLAANIASGVVTGQAIVKQRRLIRDAQKGPAIQVEREGREARIKRKTGG